MTTIRFLNKLVNSSRNLKSFRFLYNKNILRILEVLKVENIVSYTLKFDKQFGEIIFSQNLLNKLTFISKPSRVIHVSGKGLEKISYNCLVSTNKGILTKEDAVRNNTGGIILIKYELITP
jgi:ribosomal protein S8